MRSSREQGDAVQLSKVRIKATLHEALRNDAEARKITLNAALADRLERSFAGDAAYGGPQTASLFRALAGCLIAAGHDDEWMRGRGTFLAVKDLLFRQLDALAPILDAAEEEEGRKLVTELSNSIARAPDAEAKGRLRRIAKAMSEDTRQEPEIRAALMTLANGGAP